MTTEQRIMSAVVRADLFLVAAWRYALAILAVIMVTILIMVRMNR